MGVPDQPSPPIRALKLCIECKLVTAADITIVAALERTHMTMECLYTVLWLLFN